MSIEIKVPQLPESVSDATLITWHKNVGEAVSRGENLVDLETDKVVLEVPAPSAGVLQEIKVQDGAIVVAGDVLAILEPGEAAAGVQNQKAAKANKKSPQQKTREDSKSFKTSPAVSAVDHDQLTNRMLQKELNRRASRDGDG